MENHLVKITRILNFIDMQDTHCLRLLIFFNNIYMMREMPVEWKNSIIIPYLLTYLLHGAESFL